LEERLIFNNIGRSGDPCRVAHAERNHGYCNVFNPRNNLDVDIVFKQICENRFVKAPNAVGDFLRFHQKLNSTFTFVFIGALSKRVALYRIAAPKLVTIRKLTIVCFEAFRDSPFRMSRRSFGFSSSDESGYALAEIPLFL
jgi:hypothetical protein